jgi:hypothetical protein
MAAPIRVYSSQSFVALDIILPNRNNARMATKPLKEVIELDERFGWNRGEYLLACYDGQSEIGVFADLCG